MARIIQLLIIVAASALLAVGVIKYMSSVEPQVDTEDFVQESDSQNQELDQGPANLEDLQDLDVSPDAQPEIRDEIENLLRDRRSTSKQEEDTQEIEKQDVVERTEEEATEVDQAAPLEGQEEANSSDGLYSTHLSIDPIPIDRFHQLEDSIFSEKVFEYADAMHASIDKAHLSGREWREWSNNFLNLISHIESVRLRFEIDNNHNQLPGQSNAFTVEFTFDERAIIAEPRSDRTGGRQMYVATDKANFQVIARHSKPKELALAGGARLLVGFGGRQTRYLLQGNESTSVVLMIPRGPIYGPKGVIFCPRDYDIRKLRTGVKILQNTGYKLVNVDFTVRAVAEGRVSTGFGPGFAETVIQTTSNIPVESLAYDSSRSIFPFASVEVLPVKRRVVPTLIESEEITGGLRTRVTLHNSLNHKSVTEALVRLTIRELDVRSSFGISHRGNDFKVDPGPCYALVKETKVSHTFSKEKLVFENKGEQDKTLEELVDEM